METSLLLFLLLAPFAGFLFNVFFGKKVSRNVSGTIGTIAVAVSFGIALNFFFQINSTKQPILIDLFHWMTLGNFDVSFSFLLDQLSVLWLLFVTGIGTLIHIYSISYMHDDENLHKFFAYLNLFIFFMITLVTGSNLLIMFIGWEGVGLCSYLLIGFWYKNQDYNDAAKKAFIMNRIGDLGFLIGIFTLGYLFSSVDFTTIKAIVASGRTVDLGWLAFGTLCLFIGASGKSAQIPLYTWLPDAMAGPTPVSALIHAATMVTAGIFMITRLNFIFDLTPTIQMVIAIIGAITSLVAAFIALVQNDIKKVLAYSTVSQLGLMFLALGLGAYEIAVFHVITHAFFKACLFLGSGSVIHAMHGEQDMRKMGGLRKYMKVTYITFLIATLAISGIPIFAGFFSKDEILMVAFHENKALWVIASLASIMTAFYMFRLLYLTFFKEFRGTEEQKHHLHESPGLITFPLIVLAILSTVGGFISFPGHSWLNEYLKPIFIGAREEHHLDSTTFILMGVAVVGALIGIGIAYSNYIKKSQVPAEDNEITGFSKVLYNKFYVDEIYMAVIVKPIYAIASFSKNFIETALSGFIFGLGKVTNMVGTQGRVLQNGSVGFYLFVFVIGTASIIAYLFLAQ
ncbi:MAG: NADH-quinone oxidoreductase subunit L [Flavobacterium lindanitolerans]|jgi:NADH-quinone oxidoreductase subunit L|uniref:NADH-quinone oxidoreductase subunit L n=1 Tax=Flavobacterium TaxID=237 RepID=UPI0006FE3B36|nr:MULTISPECIES: NADH-quinone oxidoreductase subunit L [Flavobacterium]MBU7570057.1 NADH-quinone oxidoreductase subunit L [Flavobacterium sp.]PZQ92496.1 MAG: NADH-quinone oxidoreductase subunit L [Flavobacterium johnsoniae]KQS46400.1 NADH:ubiquinone oxidoreductase subunit L [Flavobacterium sp. Leaf359]MBL7868387.1 NADH-quinone oxidoreductase subunit L [Flavobacterium lindanitolerans]THD33124.1 MAG: NADH-quinone oxidoreductase subunit L [Flavobacterium johnsoniae]